MLNYRGNFPSSKTEPYRGDAVKSRVFQENTENVKIFFNNGGVGTTEEVAQETGVPIKMLYGILEVLRCARIIEEVRRRKKKVWRKA